MSTHEPGDLYPPTGEGFFQLIQELKAQGMTEEEFNSLRPQSSRETFRGMEGYCRKYPDRRFFDGSNNRTWQIRLIEWLTDRKRLGVARISSPHEADSRSDPPSRQKIPGEPSESSDLEELHSIPTIEPSILENREYMIRVAEIAVRDRKFRESVFRYHGQIQCAVCSVSVETLVQAAHIVPVKDGGADVPDNGLPLCANHHLAFDQHLWSIDPMTRKIVAAPGLDLDRLGIAEEFITNRVSENALTRRYHSFSKQS